PVFLGVLWWKLAGAPALPDADELAQAVTRHAGADVLQGVSSHLLVATHTFLEMMHYAVWIVAVPLVGLRTAPWKLDAVPLARPLRPAPDGPAAVRRRVAQRLLLSRGDPRLAPPVRPRDRPYSLSAGCGDVRPRLGMYLILDGVRHTRRMAEAVDVARPCRRH